MKVPITLNTDNATIKENVRAEVARILRNLASRIENHHDFADGQKITIFDLNGEKVGYCTVEEL